MNTPDKIDPLLEGIFFMDYLTILQALIEESGLLFWCVHIPLKISL